MEPFIGEIKLVPYSFAPKNWAFCNGQIMSIAQNTALFSLLGTTYGGDGRVTFGLPDLRGRAALSRGQGPGTSDYAQGDMTGAESVTIDMNTMGAHSHQVQVSADPANAHIPANLYMAVAGSGVGEVYDSAPSTTMPPGTVSLGGGPGTPHENRQPYLACNYIIALQGIFPSRP